MKSQSLKRLQLSTCLCLLQRAAGWVAPQTCECFTFLDGKLYWVRFATWGSFFFSHQSGALISFLLRLLLHAKYNLCTKEWNAAENCQFSPHLLLPSYFNDNTSCFFVLLRRLHLTADSTRNYDMMNGLFFPPLSCSTLKLCTWSFALPVILVYCADLQDDRRVNATGSTRDWPTAW